MLKQFRPLILAAFAAVAMLYAPFCLAQDEQPEAVDMSAEAVDMSTYKCKDIMRLSGDDRDTVLVAFHAYMLGKKSQLSFDPVKLGKASDDFIEYCLDHPSDNALETFAKFVE